MQSGCGWIYALQAHFPGSHLVVSFTFETTSALQVHFPGSHFVQSFEAISVLQVHFPASHLHSPLAIHLHPSTCAVSLAISFKSILQTGQDPATS